MAHSQNYLAQVRTLMANERTLMAYYRSALAMAGLAAFVFKFYVSSITTYFSVSIFILGVVLAIYGTIRYFKFKNLILERTAKWISKEV